MSALTRSVYLSTYAAWAAYFNARCWCQGRNGVPGRICRGCTRRWLWIDAITLENDLAVAEETARRSVAYA